MNTQIYIRALNAHPQDVIQMSVSSKVHWSNLSALRPQ